MITRLSSFLTFRRVTLLVLIAFVLACVLVWYCNTRRMTFQRSHYVYYTGMPASLYRCDLSTNERKLIYSFMSKSSKRDEFIVGVVGLYGKECIALHNVQVVANSHGQDSWKHVLRVLDLRTRKVVQTISLDKLYYDSLVCDSTGIFTLLINGERLRMLRLGPKMEVRDISLPANCGIRDSFIVSARLSRRHSLAMLLRDSAHMSSEEPVYRVFIVQGDKVVGTEIQARSINWVTRQGKDVLSVVTLDHHYQEYLIDEGIVQRRRDSRIRISRVAWLCNTLCSFLGVTSHANLAGDENTIVFTAHVAICGDDPVVVYDLTDRGCTRFWFTRIWQEPRGWTVSDS